MAEVSKIKLENDVYDLKDSTARTTLSNNTSYSTSTEYEVGKWTDGKTIYRKVIEKTGGSTNAEYLGNVSGIETLVSLNVWMEKSNVFRSGITCFYGGLSWASQVTFNKSTGYISIECGNDMASFKNGSTIRTIVEYTKTSS